MVFLKLNRKGFSLIDTMTALAVTSVVLMAASQVTSYVNSQVKRTVGLNDELQLQNMVQEKVNFADLCTAAMGPGAYANTAANPNPVQLNGANWQTPNGQEIQLYVPGIHSGAGMNLNTISSDPNKGDNVLPLLGLKIYSLRLQEGYPITTAVLPPNEKQYIAKLVMQVGPMPNGSSQQAVAQVAPPVVVSSVTIDLDNTNKVIDCRGGVTQSASMVCQDFGCQYNASQNPACKCPAYPRGCSDPSQVAVGIDSSGVFNCVSIKGSCPQTNQYVAGISEGSIFCATYTPPVSITTNNCPAQSTWSWGNNCSGTLPVMASPPGTTTAAVQNTANIAGGLTGQATFTCSASGLWQVNLASATCTMNSGLTCPSGVFVRWRDPNTGDPCRGSTTSTPPGQMATVSDTLFNPYLTGSATFTCQANGTWSTVPANPSCICSSGWGFEETINCKSGMKKDSFWNAGFATKATCQAARVKSICGGTGCMCSP